MLTPEQQIFEQINKTKSILVIFGENWGGDSVSSALAMFLLLRKMGKKPELVAQKFSITTQSNSTATSDGAINETPFSFLPKQNEIKHHLEGLRKYIISLNAAKDKVKQVKYQIKGDRLDFIITAKDGDFTSENLSFSPAGYNYDLIITLNAPDLEVLGEIYENNTELFYQTPLINIDHHSSNEQYGQINYVELTATSTAEILFNLFIGYSRDLIDEDIATCLLTGIIAETKSFKTPNVTPQSLLATSQLISMGARREQIVNHLYRSRSLNILKLWGRVLARLSGSPDRSFIWSTLNQMDFVKTGSSESDLTDVIDELIISIPEAKVVGLIFETKEEFATAKKTKVWLYSVKNINVLLLVKELKPQGSKDFAKTIIDKPVEEAEKQIVSLIKTQLEKLSL